MNGTIKELPETLEPLIGLRSSGISPVELLQTAWYKMQGAIDNIFDADLNKMVNITSRGVRQVSWYLQHLNFLKKKKIMYILSLKDDKLY